MKFISTGESMIKKAIMALVSLTSITAQAGEVWFKSGPRLFRMEVPMSQEDISKLTPKDKIDLLHYYEIFEIKEINEVQKQISRPSTLFDDSHWWKDMNPNEPTRAPKTFTDIKQRNHKSPNWTESAPPVVAQWTDPPSKASSGIWTER